MANLPTNTKTLGEYSIEVEELLYNAKKTGKNRVVYRKI